MLLGKGVIGKKISKGKTPRRSILPITEGNTSKRPNMGYDGQNGGHEGTIPNIRMGTCAGTSAAAKPYLESEYDLIAFLSLSYFSNPWDITSLLRGISPKATTFPYSFPPHTLGNVATNTAGLLAPDNVLQDPRISTVSPTVIAYITNMVS